MDRTFQLYKGDCLEMMKDIPDKSIDMILCDLPYGNKTECKWDVIIPFNKLWEQYERIINDRGAIVLFSVEPFTSFLIMSNIKLFKYKCIWNKEVCGSFVMAKLRPMIINEDICVFSKGNTANGSKKNMNYFPILYDAIESKIRPSNSGSSTSIATFGARKNIRTAKSSIDYNNKKRYQTNIFTYSSKMKECNSLNRLHPTQKPVDLLVNLIQLYTLENMMVLDNCMGSGSTGVACLNTNRKFIGIEKDEKYFNIAKNRIENTYNEINNLHNVEIELNDLEKVLSKEKCKNKTGTRATMGILEDTAGV